MLNEIQIDFFLKFKDEYNVIRTSLNWIDFLANIENYSSL